MYNRETKQVTVQALVIRKNDEILSVYPVEDMYTEVQLFLTVDDVTSEELRNIFQYRYDKEERVNNFIERGWYSDIQEAKDYCGDFGTIYISIEEKIINWD